MPSSITIVDYGMGNLRSVQKAFEKLGFAATIVMEEGMRHAVERQRQAIAAADFEALDAPAQLRLLVRHHFDVLLGPGSDFIPVLLYEARSLTPRQRVALADLHGEYEQAWVPVLLFAALFGISTDYEIFMVTRMREEWQRTGSNERAVKTGLRTTRFRSSLSASMAAKASRSALTASMDFSSRANSNRAVA